MVRAVLNSVAVPFTTFARDSAQGRSSARPDRRVPFTTFARDRVDRRFLATLRSCRTWPLPTLGEFDRRRMHRVIIAVVPYRESIRSRDDSC